MKSIFFLNKNIFANVSSNCNLQSPGNHEFDDGVEGFLPFLQAVNFPVLASNIQTDREPQMAGKMSKSLVVDVGQRKVAIIGYIYPDTTVNSFQTCLCNVASATWYAILPTEIVKHGKLVSYRRNRSHQQ